MMHTVIGNNDKNDICNITLEYHPLNTSLEKRIEFVVARFLRASKAPSGSIN